MKNLLVLTYWSYKDALIQTYTLPYLNIIRKYLHANSKIFLFTLEQSHLRMTSAEWKMEKKKLSLSGIHLISFKYTNFGIKAILKFFIIFLKLFYICLFGRINNIHAWCTPAGAIGYVLSVFSGKPLIIDSYEPHAESMVENGNWKKRSIAYKVLHYLEKKQSRRAVAFIATTGLMKTYAKEKYQVNIVNLYVKPACIDVNDFLKTQEIKREDLKDFVKKDEYLCIYAGKLGGIYLESEIFDFFKVAYEYWNKKFRVIMLTNTLRDKIIKYSNQSDFPADHIYSVFVPQYEVISYMALADFAINPVKPVPTKRYCTSIKDSEYWSSGLPVVITKDISDDSEIIEKHKIGSVILSLNKEAYLNSVKEIDNLLKNTDRQELKHKIQNIAIQYRSFSIAENVYKNIYSDFQKF